MNWVAGLAFNVLVVACSGGPNSAAGTIRKVKATYEGLREYGQLLEKPPTISDGHKSSTYFFPVLGNTPNRVQTASSARMAT